MIVVTTTGIEAVDRWKSTNRIYDPGYMYSQFLTCRSFCGEDIFIAIEYK